MLLNVNDICLEYGTKLLHSKSSNFACLKFSKSPWDL